MANKRSLKLSLVIQSFRKWRGRLLIALLILVFLFVSVAVLQHWFVHAQLYRTTRQELGLWAEQVVKEIAYKEKWDLTGYRRASIEAPAWNIITKDGLIVEIEGFIPGLFGKTQLPDESIYTRPKTEVTTTYETWRLFGRKVLGGFVVLGIRSPDKNCNVDTKLLANAVKFGSTLDEAASTGSREIDFEVEYIVLSSTGEIKSAWGAVPLRTDPHAFPAASDHLARLISGGKPYLLYFRPILDSAGQEVGVVIIPKDMSLVEQAGRAQDKFNFWVVGIAALLACAIALSLIVRQFLAQTQRVSLKEALKIGESLTIEFKSTFQWDLRRNRFNEERRLDTLKSIAGFLNTRGGTLFIGVSEDTKPPTLRGLREDLAHVGGSKDLLQRTLRDLITTRIGSRFSPFITDKFDQAEGGLYWEVRVEESSEPAFVRWKLAGETKEQKKFYVREGPKTSDLDNESTWRYIKNRWG